MDPPVTGNFVDTPIQGEAIFKQSNGRRDIIEAKMLNGCGAEIRRHSLPGSMPHNLPFSNQNGAIRGRRERMSLDSIVSKPVADYPSFSQSSQSLFLKSAPTSWLEGKKSDNMQNIPPATHLARHPPVQGQPGSSSGLSSGSDSPSGVTPTSRPGIKGTSLPSVPLASSNSKARYSPMFIQHDSFSSPFTAPTIFEKPSATVHVKAKDPKQYWKPSDSPGPQVPESEILSFKERTETRLPVISPGLGSHQLGFSEARATGGAPVSTLRGTGFEYREFSSSRGPISLQGEAKKLAESTDLPGDGSHPSISLNSVKGLTTDNTVSNMPRLSIPSEPEVRTLPKTNPSFEGHLPDISGLLLAGGSQKDITEIQKETSDSRRSYDFRPKAVPKREKDEGDSDIDTDRSETDSGSGDIHERELSGIDASDSEDDPSRSRSFWQAKRAGNQNNNSVTVSVLELYKTEICLNWLRTRNCSYGNKCHYAHGMADLRTRQRIETYKTQPCADPARNGCHVCMYTSRCNYAHPGEPIRRMGPYPGKKYFDPEYFEALRRDYPYHEMPFGVFV
jgi:hypothetical protein